MSTSSSDSAVWHMSVQCLHSQKRKPSNCGFCTSGLNDPFTLSQIVQTRLLDDCSRRHRIKHVLQIGGKQAPPLRHHSESRVPIPQRLNDLKSSAPKDHIKGLGRNPVSDFQVHQVNTDALLEAQTARQHSWTRWQRLWSSFTRWATQFRENKPFCRSRVSQNACQV